MTETSHEHAKTLTDDVVEIPPTKTPRQRGWGQRSFEWAFGSLPLFYLFGWWLDKGRDMPILGLGMLNNLTLFSLFFVLLFYGLIAKDQKLFHPKTTLWPFSMVALVVLFTLFLSPIHESGFKLFGLYVAIIIGAWATLGIKMGKQCNPDESKKWAHYTSWCFVITSVLSLISITTFPYEIIDADHRRSMFLYVHGFSNTRAMGDLAIVAMGAAFGLALIYTKPAMKIFLFLLTAGISVALFWSGTRAGMIVIPVLVLISVWWIWTQKRHNLWKTLGALVLSVATGAAITLTLLPIPVHSSFGLRIDRFERTISDVEVVVQRIQGDEKLSTTDNLYRGRSGLWRYAIENIQERPLTGHGMFPLGGDPDRPDSMPYYHYHNIVLELLVSFGVVLGTILLAIFLAGLWAVTKLAKRSPHHLPVALGAWAIFLVGMNSGIYITPIYMVFLAFWSAYAWMQNKTT